MTSVAIVSGAVGRIECATKQASNNEAVKLLEDLISVKEWLMKAYDEKKEEEKWFVPVEKEIVGISYEIVDATATAADAPPRSRDIFAALVGRSRNTEIARLQDQLHKLREKLESPPSPTALPTEEEETPTSDTEDEPAGGHQLEGLREALSIESSSEFSVVCIQGESGMGKSTLAKKVFADDRIRSSFDVWGWVSMKQVPQTRRLLQALLQQLGSLQYVDIRDMNEIQLIEKIFAVLEKKKYLLVLNDVPAVDDWQSIRVALPSAKSSRLLITTNSDQVATAAARPQTAIYRMPRLTRSEALQTLMEVEGPSSSLGSHKVGNAIFDISDGSPLLAIILGKSLQSEVASEQELVHDLLSYLPHKGTPQVLGACYKRLPPGYKPVLLYLALFPEGQDIQVDKLHLLLAAEDLIPPDQSRTFLESALRELSLKKLVKVQQDKSGAYKSCKLHHQVREFCKLRGSSEDLFHIVDMVESLKKPGHNTRRLAIDLNKCRDGNSNPHEAAKQIRSLLIFDTLEPEQKSRWPSEIFDFKELGRLRVANLDEVDFRVRKSPKGMEKLIFLRYLSFRGCWLQELPSSLSKLTHLETLDLLVHADCQMIIQNILTNMKRLVHLYFPRLYQSDGKSKVQLQGLERLETVVNFDTEACDVQALSHLKKLEILTTIPKGDHEDLTAVINFLGEQAEKVRYSSMDIRNLDRYNKDSISALKEVLKCQYLHSIRIAGQIGELTQVSSSTKIAEIELSGCELEQSPMDVLGGIPSLRSLVLTKDAFVKSEVVIPAAPLFPNLRSLKLQNLQYLEKLTIEEGAMPELSSLEIDGCSCLIELSIPKELDDRLKKAQGDNAYSVMPLPSEFTKT